MRVVQFSPPRTGSTLVWQVLNRLPNVEARKEHEWKEEFAEYPVIATMRDPRDMCASMWRFERNLGLEQIIAGRTMNREEILLSFGYAQTVARQYGHHWTDPHILWLRYELFWNEPAYLFTAIGDHLNVHLTPVERARISALTSIAANKARSSEFAGHEDYDLRTHIHGCHIMTGEPGSWRLCVPERMHDLYSDGVLAAFTDWDTEWEDA